MCAAMSSSGLAGARAAQSSAHRVRHAPRTSRATKPSAMWRSSWDREFTAQGLSQLATVAHRRADPQVAADEAGRVNAVELQRADNQSKVAERPASRWPRQRAQINRGQCWQSIVANNERVDLSLEPLAPRVQSGEKCAGPHQYSSSTLRACGQPFPERLGRRARTRQKET